MNVSLQQQSTELPLSHLSALHREEPWPTNSPYIPEAFGVLLFQRWRRLVLRCAIKETSEDRLPVLTGFSDSHNMKICSSITKP